jgi:hypothetical protein
MALTPEEQRELQILEAKVQSAQQTTGALQQTLTEGIPALAGGIVGETVGFGAGGVPGAILGGGVGAAAGEITRQAAQALPTTPLPPEAAARGFGLRVPSELQPAIQAARGAPTFEPGRVAGEAAIGAVGAGVGAGIFRVAQKALSPFKSSVVQSMKRLREIFGRVGGRFTPAQATDNKLIDFVEEVVEGSFAGQARFRTFKEGQQQAIKRLSKVVADQLTDGAADLSDEAIGELFLASAKQGRIAHKAASNRLYASVDDVLQGAAVKTIRMKDAARALQQKITQTKGFARTAEIDEAIQATLSLPKNIPFGQAHAIRSALLQKVRDLGATAGKGQAKAGLAQLVGPLDESMEVAGKSLSGKARNLWRNANTFFKQGKEVFENDLMANLIIKNKKAPEKIGEVLFRKGNVSEIKKAKAALALANKLDPSISQINTWNAMKSGYYQGLINRHTDAASQTLNAKGLIRELEDRRTLRTLTEVLSRKEIKQLRNFARIAEKTQEKTGASGAAVAIKLAQFQAGVTLLSAPFFPERFRGPVAAGSLAIIFGPAIMARLMTSPSGIKLLTEGFELSGKGAVATRSIPSFLSKLSAKVGIETLSKQDLNESKTVGIQGP